jgi:hypothetical protein
MQKGTDSNSGGAEINMVGGRYRLSEVPRLMHGTGLSLYLAWYVDGNMTCEPRLIGSCGRRRAILDSLPLLRVC